MLHGVVPGQAGWKLRRGPRSTLRFLPNVDLALLERRILINSSVDATALGRLPDAADSVFGEPGSVLARALELGLSTCGSTAEETLKPAVMSDEGKAKPF